jgi:prepilin-type N-terminal cleavage/methylation domain-containing protein
MRIGRYDMTKRLSKAPLAREGFSLAEVLAAMTIGALILVAVLTIYSRADRTAAAVTHRLDSSRLSSEVLQRIAEDLDRVTSSDTDTKITIENKFKNSFPAAKLTITKTFKDSKNTDQKFEEIIWQSLYDYESPDDGLVLYRSHSGITPEDKILDKNKDQIELERLVPICSGVTFFRIEALKGGKPVAKWDDVPPPGMTATISFAEPVKSTKGTLDVPDKEKITRTIAIDRTREIRFALETTAGPEDANAPAQNKAVPEKTTTPEKTAALQKTATPAPPKRTETKTR